MTEMTREYWDRDQRFILRTQVGRRKALAANERLHQTAIWTSRRRKTPVREEEAAMTEYSNTAVKPDTIERLKDSAQSERCGGQHARDVIRRNRRVRSEAVQRGVR